MYTAFYGLTDEPFRLTPDPRFLHLADFYRDVAVTLFNSIGHRKGFAVLTGPVGTGKTTLLHACLHVFYTKIKDRRIESALLVNPMLSRDEFLESVLDEFEIKAEGSSKPARLSALHKYLLEIQADKGVAVLIVDEAHLLSPELLEEIRLLSNLDHAQGKLLQVVLSGQPELEALLSQPSSMALRHRVATWMSLRSLAPSEVRAYISQRLHTAGLTGPSPFSGAAIDAVIRYSGGTPRTINLICDQALTLGATTRVKLIGADLVEEAAHRLRLVPEITNVLAAATATSPAVRR